MVVALVIAVVVCDLISIITLLESVIDDAVHAARRFALVGAHVVVIRIPVVTFLTSVLSAVPAEVRCRGWSRGEKCLWAR